MVYRKSDFERVAEIIEGDAQKLVLSALQNCKPRSAAQSLAYSTLSFSFMCTVALLTHCIGLQTGMFKPNICAEPHELSIVLCDDEYMAAVNNEWRGQNRPTDVLSFEIPHDEFTAV